MVATLALILTFSPGEKEPLHLKMPSASFLSHSLPLGETHAQAAVRAVFQQSARPQYWTFDVEHWRL